MIHRISNQHLLFRLRIIMHVEITITVIALKLKAYKPQGVFFDATQESNFTLVL